MAKKKVSETNNSSLNSPEFENDRAGTVIVSESRHYDDNTFRGFIENLPVIFYAVEPEPPHTPIYISQTFEKFGYPLDVWRTNSSIWDEVIHKDDRKWVLDGTREAMLRGEGIDFRKTVFKIYKSTKQLLKTAVFESGFENIIPIADLSPGIYFIDVLCEKSYKAKFIISR